MKHFNLFYIAVILLGVGLFFMFQPQFHDSDISFYGFAESNETEINYNYAVVVDRIHVSPGQQVKKGDILMHISRRKSKETLENQGFKIAQLRAEEKIWNDRKRNEIKELLLEKETKLSEFDARIEEIRDELAYKKHLSADLQSLSRSKADYSPLEAKIDRLQIEKINTSKLFDSQIIAIKSEIELGANPYQVQINEHEADRTFDNAQKVINIDVTAPADGLIGTIACKEQEHVPSYSTLLTFYEPHSSIVKGFVHEDLTLKVQIGDLYMASSLKDEKIRYNGKVVGLGSRIVEIPLRLRKLMEVKTYGREVLVQIPKDNTFLQKEKVSLKYIGSNH